MTGTAITSADLSKPRRYIEVLEALGAEVRLTTPQEKRSADALMRGVGGLLLPGGPDVDPVLYGADANPTADLDVCSALDELELTLLRYALDRDMPVLAIGRGMQLLNVAQGGQLIQDLPGHKSGQEQGNGRFEPPRHLIYLSPGAKASAVIGSAGFFRVNSFHHQGLREAQRSPRLMSTAYSVEDSLIEGLESPEHSWVIGLQCHPERQDEVPRSFANLFAALVERAEMYLEGNAGYSD